MRSKKHVIGFVVMCVVIGLGIGGVLGWQVTKDNKPAGTVKGLVSPLIPEPVVKSAHILFVGDIMTDRGVENSVKNNMGGDFARLFDNIGDYFKSADFAFGNLEGPVTAKGPNVGSRFSFAMDTRILPVLTANNFKIVSFANNHVGDRSNSGFADTLTNLDASGLLYTGAGQNVSEASTPKIVTANGLKIGFIACTDVGPDWLAAKETTPGILLCSNPKLAEIISTAKAQTDFLVFSAHWGTEYYPRSTRQQTLAHLVIDNGADMVIGHHPHVIEATEWYNGKFIAYSLGNFIFDQYFSPHTMHGLIIEATVGEHSIKESDVKLKIVELSPDGNKYQPKNIRDATPADFITKGVVAAQTCPSAKEAETNKWLLPVGPDLDIGNYTPKGLIPLDNRINVKTTASCLTELAANALITMVSDMEDAGLKVIMTSGFRSRNTQEYVLGNSNAANATTTVPSVPTYPSVALPGHSEHQLGVAVDLKSGNDPALSYDNFKNSPEYAWLLKNAYKYGFIQSYQAGKEPITGYMAEAWHYRYVGKEHAKAIRDQGITTYEYLKNLAQ